MRETIQNANGKQFHAVSLSGGKDSTAMLLLMIERDMPINMVLSADTGMEFPEMYEHLAKLDEHLFRERGMRQQKPPAVMNLYRNWTMAMTRWPGMQGTGFQAVKNSVFLLPA